MVKKMTMAEIRDSLTRDDMEGADGNTLYEVFLNGCTGYNNYENEDCIDWYVNKNYPDTFEEDENPVEVLHILDDGNGQVMAKVIQHQGSIDIEWVVG